MTKIMTHSLKLAALIIGLGGNPTNASNVTIDTDGRPRIVVYEIPSLVCYQGRGLGIECIRMRLLA